MTVRTRAQLNSDADTNLADNTSADVSPADVRQRIKDLADSATLAEDIYSGAIIQTVRATPYTTNTTTTSVIPADDTIPQNTEGTQVLTASITPKLATSKIVAFAVLNGTPSGGNRTIVFAMNRDAVANSFAATEVFVNDGVGVSIALEGEFSPGDTSSHTVNVRIGPGAAGTIAFNGLGSGRLLGGAMAMTLELREIKA